MCHHHIKGLHSSLPDHSRLVLSFEINNRTLESVHPCTVQCEHVQSILTHNDGMLKFVTLPLKINVNACQQQTSITDSLKFHTSMWIGKYCPSDM